MAPWSSQRSLHSTSDAVESSPQSPPRSLSRAPRATQRDGVDRILQVGHRFFGEFEYSASAE